MNPLVIWKNNTFNIVLLNKKYSLFDNDKLLIKEYDSIRPCSDYFFIGCLKKQQSYKYQLFNNNGDIIFGDNKLFEFISYNKESNIFTFYDYYNKIDLTLPNLSKEKNQLFFLFLNKLYNKKNIDIDNYQSIVNEINKKIENINEKDINEIIENLELVNNLYLMLNKPSYLKDYLTILDEDGQKSLLRVINNNKKIILKDLTKDIFKNPKVYDLNEDIIAGIISNNEIISLNKVLNSLNKIHDNLKDRIMYYKSSRNTIFSSLNTIDEYFRNKDSIKYFDDNDFKYIKKNKNLFLNIMYNNKNKNILSILEHYYIDEVDSL